MNIPEMLGTGLEAPSDQVADKHEMGRGSRVQVERDEFDDAERIRRSNNQRLRKLRQMAQQSTALLGGYEDFGNIKVHNSLDTYDQELHQLLTSENNNFKAPCRACADLATTGAAIMQLPKHKKSHRHHHRDQRPKPPQFEYKRGYDDLT